MGCNLSRWAIYALVYLSFAWLPQSLSWGVWPLMAIYGIHMALTEGVDKALIADFAPKEYRGTAMGIYYGITGITTFLASFLAGWVWSAFGSAYALTLGFVFAVLALLVMMQVNFLARIRANVSAQSN